MTILINIETNQPVSEFFSNGYFVDGKKPNLPKNIVEFEVIDTPQPSLNENQIANFNWSLTEKGWEKIWFIEEIPKPIEEPLYEYYWALAKPFRVVVNNDIWKDWFAKRRDHEDYLKLTGKDLYPDLIELLLAVEMVSNDNIINAVVNTYIYLDMIFDIHRPIILKYGGIIEDKPKFD